MKTDHGASAQLRRCSSPEEVALQPYTYGLKQKMPNWISIESLATIAGILSHIKSGELENISLAAKLAKPKSKNDNIPFSESRFRQLLTCKNWNEFYTSLRRAVKILDGNVNPLSIVDVILQWDEEQKDNFNKRLGNSLKFEMSKEYYTELMKH